MSKSTQRNRSKIIVLAFVLLVPGFLYIAVNRFGVNSYVSLPVFGEKQLSGEMKRNWGREYPDTVFHTLSPIGFQDISGKELTALSTDTCISIMHLFYTRDEAFSRLMLDHIDALATRFQANGIVNFYSISVDSSDTEATLGAFVRQYRNLPDKHWHVVFNPSADIFSYAREHLLIDAMVDPADSSRFLISNKMVLVDSRKRIRGFYDISQKDEVDRLQDEVKLLLVEEVRNRSLKIEKK